ncbi:hypothetical protein [Qipengyuania oceanensis]|uniref:Uncharacterized protein n=1 Tax=Qipengyuania oceanensis TaxID=1463597 RepID=A0A844YFI1_9SPHN|nr:hypothetical protein [Qipengyuania oceanensis]MXO62911.1 hypothetical protein [Qipengyuania oceanensis]
MRIKRDRFGKGGFAPALLAGAAMALALPTAGLAVVSAGLDTATDTDAGFAQFTPAQVDPALAQRVAKVARAKGVRFTPAEMGTRSNRSVTVAVRVNDKTARAISVRSALKAAAGEMGQGSSIALAPTRYNLGVSRGYQTFAKQPLKLPDTISRVSMPDLAAFKPSEGTAAAKPGRFQSRIALEEEGKIGRAPNTLEGAGEQSVEVSGSYRVLRNLDVTAGVRLSQERDRLAPLTDSVQDSQAVYVGTQFRF